MPVAWMLPPVQESEIRRESTLKALVGAAAAARIHAAMRGAFLFIILLDDSSIIALWASKLRLLLLLPAADCDRPAGVRWRC